MKFCAIVEVIKSYFFSYLKFRYIAVGRHINVKIHIINKSSARLPCVTFHKTTLNAC